MVFAICSEEFEHFVSQKLSKSVDAEYAEVIASESWRIFETQYS